MLDFLKIILSDKHITSMFFILAAIAFGLSGSLMTVAYIILKENWDTFKKRKENKHNVHRIHSESV